ncbi:endo-1,4-beta xylanase [Mycena albidolilacea]|uniref:endo-1,4-beta-xylanase n=1 Tax=Mycena albidolilacea TaxID=1033008 RepID=A0AAD6Z0S7_9AGAR|nr:endo-1,4-beta xylanase [Mycena albidolilacea]
MLRISVALAAALAILPTAIGQAPIWGQFKITIRHFRSATDNYELNDPAYAAKLKNNSVFGQITPRSVFTFENGDAIVALAKKNGQLLRAGCISYDEVPNWVNSAEIPGSALMNNVVNHCSTLIKHYADAWDIVNEPFTDDGFTRPLGFSISSSISYIDTLLLAARAADPSAKLYLSSSGIDTPGPKLESMISQVQYYKDHGIPIDGVGLRSHFVSGEVPSLANLTANYERLTTLGVEIAITALDIRTSATPSGAPILQQQTDYKTVISACKAVAGCVGVTLSDISDKYSLIPGICAGFGRALPWDTNFLPKPAYDGIIAGFKN